MISQFVGWSADPVVAKGAGPHRVLYVDHTARLGGGELSLAETIEHLDRSRVDPTVLLFSEGPLAERFRSGNVETHVIPLVDEIGSARKDSLGISSLLRFREIGQALRFARKVSQFMRGGGFDIVHTNSLKSDLIGGVAARWAGLPVVWHVRDRIADDYLPKTVARGFRLAGRVLPHWIIANSDATLATLGTKPGRHMSVVHCGIPAGPEPVHSSDASPNPLIALVGRIAPWKGQHIFVRAAAAVRQKHPHARFVIVGAPLFGEEPYERAVRSLVRDLDLTDIVKFTGFRADVREVLADVDILVHASTVPEPFGRVIVEGMAAGLPVIATNGGGAAEIIVDGVSGKLVEMNSDVALAHAISRLLDDPALSRQLALAGRKRLEECFTIERSVNQLQSLYDKLLEPALA